MLKITCITALLLFSAGSPVLLAAQSARGNGNGPAARLRSDIQRAIQNGNPTQDELTTLQKSLATLRDARAARQQGQPVDRQRVQSALADAEKVFQSNSFRAADRQAVERDVQELRSRHEK